ncbi:amidohydrolase family protein [Streptomyces sp. NPDC002514]|uniref:amidohydrolase family protein n=1 Tax=Streptomyces sp. NPDC001270 TaxID=3364554 RepID=UPI0036C4B83F
MAASTARIDVHQHIVPPRWRDALDDRGLDSGGWPVPAWSTADAIAMMDRQNIATGVLSVTSPGVHLGDDAEARALARAVNEYGAEQVKDHPSRIGCFASVPLPDVDGALEEATYALDVLGADGVVLMSNTHGRYLGDPDFEPLWAELDRRSAVVFVHPAQPPMPLLAGTPAPLVDYVFDTTRSAVNMALAGVLSRHRDVKVVLSHGGGFLPYAAYRFSVLTSMAVEPGRDGDELLRDLKRFFFDTALASGPSALPSLLAFAEPGHILYGSDWPFAPEEAGSRFNHYLDTAPGIDPGQAHAIGRGSAEALFPRLAGLG